MDATCTTAAAAGDDLPGKRVGTIDVVHKIPADARMGKFEAGEQEQKAPLLGIKEELDDNMFGLLFDDENKVTGWIAETGTSLRQEQKVSQEKKAEGSAAKKGLGYFCYGSHGAYKTKF